MNFYNEFDPKAAAWLRELIKQGQIPDGVVDERSIKDLDPYELTGYTQHHFFAGIGGWSRALELARWPADKPVITGSCPCQPYSAAGKRKGDEDERNLWPDFFRILRVLRPEFVFGEQVSTAIAHGWLDRVCADLEAEGYSTGACVLGAHSVGAPHIRQRLYWGGRLEHAASDGRLERRPESSERCATSGCGESGLANSQQQGLEGHAGHVADRREPGRIDTLATGSTTACCESRGLADSDGARREPSERETEREARDETRLRMSGTECSDGGVADSNRERFTGRPERVGEANRPELRSPFGDDAGGCCGSFWSGAIWHPCTDGKLRRIHPQSDFQRLFDGLPAGLVTGGIPSEFLNAASAFPLAQGVSHRVALLRGFGNAVIPQLAAVFIKGFSA